MFTEKPLKVFVALAVLSFVGLLILQQSLTFHRVAMFIQDPSKKPSRVRNRFKLQNAKSEEGSYLGSRELGNEYDHNQELNIDSSIGIPVSQTLKETVEHRSSVSFKEAHEVSKSLEKQKSRMSSPKTLSKLNSPEQQTTSPSLDRRSRLPKALIIGFSKCGTAALRTFLTIHPDVISPILELRYFTEYYSKGPEWYRRQMPPSTEEQLTIEKTPAYIMTNESLTRIQDFDPKIKLIVIVRDPIVRLQSQYAHVFCHTKPSLWPPFKHWWNEKPHDQRIIHFSYYAWYIRQVYNQFPREKVLILSEDDMERNPLPVLKEAEGFLGLRPAYTDDMFVFNKEKGFYCFNTRSRLFPRVLRLVKVNRFTGCLGGDKGREHPPIGKNYLEHLRQVIRPLNEELFSLIGKRFQWDNFKKKP
ncbi:heparan sulfate glucosamine 3-O-sulfotransferase [Elysia marginata]|uniref:Heparan sulfate glucosamine 3-O-sulfotransferase n=1 Tax=Elysia marginata TaxID=1093978 RepID=A0AAV4FD12_9GAST|nr:heparan sulfate glucosamine 3-O-sulfotransferase [Elysia marginata]